jgi:hypothetical protein
MLLATMVVFCSHFRVNKLSHFSGLILFLELRNDIVLYCFPQKVNPVCAYILSKKKIVSIKINLVCCDNFFIHVLISFTHSDMWVTSDIHPQVTVPIIISMSGMGAQGYPCTTAIFWSIVCQHLLYSTSNPISLTKYSMLHNRISS